MEKELSNDQVKALLNTLSVRFEKNKKRHVSLEWAAVEAKLLDNKEKLWSLNEMEQTGGEPDVLFYDATTNEYVFFDCSAESPKGRRSLCYDRVALESRKEFKPVSSAIDVAAGMGIELLSETEYRFMHQYGVFDSKSSSWVQTPEAIRKLGGAVFCDRRYDHVFLYHNGAESYYAARGFRGKLNV